MSRSLHMVCLRSPWPADTGGARDMLERLKALKQAGIRVHLHYFIRKDEAPADALIPLCDRISVYRRNDPWDGIRKGLPYIVACRSDERLFKQLTGDWDPILFDGIHTTAHLPKLHEMGRKMVIRMHNEEVRYYRSLIRFERNLIKKAYLYWESVRIKRWMKQLPKDVPLGCIQSDELEILKHQYGFTHSFLLPPPIPDQVDIAVGTGGYCLYHGNLSIGENERAAIWLLRRVFAQIKLPLVITGRSPSRKLEQLVHFYQHTCLVADPSESELRDLIRKAQINVLPSMTDTGIKLKIFDALQYGRHCVINTKMQVGSPWTDSCTVSADASEMAADIQRLYPIPFTGKMIQERSDRLIGWRNQLDPVEALIKRLW